MCIFIYPLIYFVITFQVQFKFQFVYFFMPHPLMSFTVLFYFPPVNFPEDFVTADF